MKRIATTLFAVFAAVPLAGASEGVVLKHKRIEGAKSKVEITSKAQQVMTIAGMDIETASESIVVVSFNSGKRDAQGNLPVKQSFESMFTQVALPGGIELTYDSANPMLENDTPELKALLEAWNAMAKASFTIVLNKQGRAVEVIGSADAIEGLGDTAKTLIKAELDPEYLKLAANQEFDKFPDRPVQKGDNWMRTEVARLGAGQAMTFQTRYEYQGTVDKDGKTLDKIGVKVQSVSYSMDADSPGPLKVVQSDLKIDSSEGTVLFDRELGDQVEAQTKIRITGDMTFSINGMELPGELDLTLESKTVRIE